MQNIRQLEEILESARLAARIPGFAIAVVAGAQTIYAQGFGYRDLKAQLPMTADTAYPIASTTKAINATLLGILVDEGRLAWDAPVQEYLPRFRLQDRQASVHVTIRDLIVMRTGLACHEFISIENPIRRAELIECLPHLPLSASFRERFQYTNVTPTVAGHVAEIVCGETWEDLVRARIFEPLGMRDTGFAVPTSDIATLAYHESRERRLLPTPRWLEEAIAPAGGTIHSTVNDMAKWLAFNLNNGEAAGKQLIQPSTLREIQAPWVVMGSDPAAPSPNASYGCGWFVDTYNGRPRLSHTGLLYDVNSCVTVHPADSLAIVSFTNFASSRLAQLINQYAFDFIMGLKPVQTFEAALQSYEQRVADVQRRNQLQRRVLNTSASHPMRDYTGVFEHRGYGRIVIRLDGDVLSLGRNALVLPLEHWHYDAWVVADNDMFEIHKPHAFDRANRLLFHSNADGDIEALSIRLDPALEPIRFHKQ